jgi:hypothetical protein
MLAVDEPAGEPEAIHRRVRAQRRKRGGHGAMDTFAGPVIRPAREEKCFARLGHLAHDHHGRNAVNIGGAIMLGNLERVPERELFEIGPLELVCLRLRAFARRGCARSRRAIGCSPASRLRVGKCLAVEPDVFDRAAETHPVTGADAERLLGAEGLIEVVDDHAEFGRFAVDVDFDSAATRVPSYVAAMWVHWLSAIGCSVSTRRQSSSQR